MQTRVKLSAPVLCGLFLAAGILLFVEHDLTARVLHHLFQSGIEIQRDFSRTLAGRLREVKEGGSPGSLWIALGLAFTYGVVHAIGPGHGKFVVTTYFLSHERRVWRGFLMGAQLAVMHVISAIVIVLVAHYLAVRMYGRTGDMTGLRTASYASIALVGVYMLWKARRSRAHGHDHEGHDHAGCGHGHGHDGRQGMLSFTIGIAPCSGAVLLLIYAFANDIVWLGVLMTAAIAAGMAITMIALGLLAIFARRLMIARIAREQTAHRLARVVEVGGACLIVLFGLGMTAASLTG